MFIQAYHTPKACSNQVLNESHYLSIPNLVVGALHNIRSITSSGKYNQIEVHSDRRKSIYPGF